jgi:hypothetical protein
MGPNLFLRAVTTAQRLYKRRGWPPQLLGRGMEISGFREVHRAAAHQAAREGRMVNIHFTFFPPEAGNGFLVSIRSRKIES